MTLEYTVPLEISAYRKINFEIPLEKYVLSNSALKELVSFQVS